jgi:beta-galactosidase
MPKFHAFREVLAKYVVLPDLTPPPLLPRAAPQTVRARCVTALRDRLDDLATPVVHRPTPEPIEKLGHAFGLVHYRRRVAGPARTHTLRIEGVRDLAHVFAGGELLGVLERDKPQQSLALQVPDTGLDLEILVEPLGRVNYGPHLADRKGLIGGVRLDHQFLFGWEHRVLPLHDVAGVCEGPRPGSETVAGPLFHHATVTLPEPADAFVAVPSAVRCLVWLNGFLLGRLWDRGPQVTLYAPAPLWRSGGNDLVVLSSEPRSGEASQGLDIEVRDGPDLGPLAQPYTHVDY